MKTNMQDALTQLIIKLHENYVLYPDRYDRAEYAGIFILLKLKCVESTTFAATWRLTRTVNCKLIATLRQISLMRVQ